MWERKIRAKMPRHGTRSESERRKGHQRTRFPGSVKEDMSQCTCASEMTMATTAPAAECMANAPNADAAMFCVL